MSLEHIPAGAKAPEEFNVIIEIPMSADPVKYEANKETGTLFVDRFLSTSMIYPANYGYVPQTLSDDGDAVDVLVLAPHPVQPGATVPCRAIGVLEMEDEAGLDAKVLAVPTVKILPSYSHLNDVGDVNQMLLDSISHFFSHYKDLEKGKWAKVVGWKDAAAARKEIENGLAAYGK